MPMKLRDGKIYQPLESVHMMLRDGKIVDASQSILYDQFDLVDQPSTPTKYKIQDLRIEFQARTKPESENPAINPLRRSGLMMSSLEAGRDEWSQQTVESVKSIKSTRTVTTSTTKLTVHQLPVFEHAEDDSGFITSTPLHSIDIGLQQVYGQSHEGSFTLPEINATEVTDNASLQQDKQKSFTRIRTRNYDAKECITPAAIGQRTNIGWESLGKTDGIEQYIFEDLSKPLIYSYLSDDLSESEVSHDQTDFSRIRRRSLSYPTALNRDYNINHARWGLFHDRRRQWYLNRWDSTAVQVSKRNLIYTIFQTILSVMITIQTFIHSQSSKILHFFFKHNNVTEKRKQRRMRKITISTYTRTRHEHIGIMQSVQRCFYLYCLPVFVAVAVLIMISLLFPYLKENIDSSKGLNLTEHGLKNAYYIPFGTRNTQPVWVIRPEMQKSAVDEQILANGFPVIFYVTKEGYQEPKHSINVFKVLSDGGYNIITPVYPVYGINIVDPWTSMKKFANGTDMYLWGDRLPASDMSDLAKDLCRQGVPPSGVIIETDVFDKELGVGSLEVWSCNCTKVNKENGDPFTYTHVKCPISDIDVNNDVIQCLKALKEQSPSN